MIDIKYVHIKSSYLIVVKFVMSITVSDGRFNLFFKEWTDHIGISFGKIAKITSLYLK